MLWITKEKFYAFINCHVVLQELLINALTAILEAPLLLIDNDHIDDNNTSWATSTDTV